MLLLNENVVRSRYLLHNPLLRPKPGVANASSPQGSEGSLVTLRDSIALFDCMSLYLPARLTVITQRAFLPRSRWVVRWVVPLAQRHCACEIR